MEFGLEVDVQRGVGALAQGSLHGQVVPVGGPGVVDCTRDAHVAVADAGVGVGDGDGVELRGDHGVGDVAQGRRRGGCGVGDDVEIGVDRVVWLCCLTRRVLMVSTIEFFQRRSIPEVIVEWLGLLKVGMRVAKVGTWVINWTVTVGSSGFGGRRRRKYQGEQARK